MPMKRRKYAEGGLVVSRGGRDTSGLRLFDDTPAAGIGTSRAIAEMVANDEVSARPTMEELQAANLAAVRAREARETAKPVRRQAPAPKASTPRAVPKADESNPPATTRAAPKPAANSDFAAFRKRMIDNTPTMRRLPSEAEIKEAYANRNRTPASSPRRTTYKSPRTTVAELRARGVEAARRRAAADSRDAQRDEFDSRFGVMQRTRPPAMLALKKGGPVKKADLMKKMAEKKPAAKADKAKKAMPMALMMAMAVPAKGAKKPVKKAAGGAIKQVKGYAMGGKVGCGHKGMKKK